MECVGEMRLTSEIVVCENKFSRSRICVTYYVNHSYRKIAARFDIQKNRALASQISEFPFSFDASKDTGKTSNG